MRHVYRRPCILGSGGVRSRRRPGPLVRSRHKLRDGRPAAQSRPVQWPQAAEEYTGGTFFCLWFVLARTPVANVELLSCKLIFSQGRRRIPDFGKRRSCPCRRASRSVFAIPTHPPADFHSCHFMPPVCTGAVMVSGSDARSQESGRSCAHDPAACAPDCLLVPLMGRWTPYWGAGRWTP